MLRTDRTHASRMIGAYHHHSNHTYVQESNLEPLVGAGRQHMYVHTCMKG